MSNISRALRLAAAAQRVSMENADPAVQGQEGELNEQELASVAAKAAADVAADAADKAKEAAGGETTETAEAAPTETADATETSDVSETPAAEEAPAGDEAAAAADVTETANTPAEEVSTSDAPATDEAATDDAPATDAPATDEAAAGEEVDAEAAAIETPAEAELEQLAADEPPAVEGEAAATSEIPEGGETQTEAVGISDADLGAAAETGEVAAAAVEEAVAADDSGVVDADAAPAEAVAEDAPAEAVVDDAAPVTDVVAEEPAAAEPAQTEAAAEEPAPAAAPGPQTDTSEAVQEVVNLTEAIAEAATAEDVVKQVRKMSDGLNEITETAEVVNESGGVTMESFAMMQLALKAQVAPLERPQDINLGISFESFAGKPAGTRLQVSLEEIADVIAELDQSQPYLERQAVESLDRVVAALKDAIPSAVDRLKATISQAQASADTNEGAPVKIGDGLSAALCVNGAFPTDLANELQTYSLLGNTLLGNYSDAAFRSAQQSSLLVNAIDYSSVNAFWEKVGAIVNGAVDPRSTMTATQIEACLPGSASLFGEAQPDLDSPNAVLKALIAFNNSHAPLEAMLAGKCEGESEATAPALSASKIVLVAKALLEALCPERINDVLDKGRKLWPEAQDAIRHLRENLGNAPREIDQNIGADFSQLIKYVETNYSLATWPIVNYLANAVLTVNAFVVFADRSLKAKAEELPAVETTDTVVEEAAPAADAAVEEVAADATVSDEPPGGEEVTMESVQEEISELEGKLSQARARLAAISGK